MSKTPKSRPQLFTVGHSNHEIDRFIKLLRRHDIEALADVRSSPYSRFNPQYNRETLQASLNRNGIGYVFLGEELGARRSEDECYIDNRADYERIAVTDAFSAGLARLRKDMRERRAALMCSEKDPLTCHRMILVCRRLKNEAEVKHILEDGSLETTADAEDRLLKLVGLPSSDLFRDRAALVDEAYERQGHRIAYTREPTAGAGVFDA